VSASTDVSRPGVLTEHGQQALRQLLRSWFEFERRLAKVPILQRLDSGRFSVDDYRRLLLNLRPQVVEGARWISRCASSFDREHADIRSVIIGHAFDEHRDYEILETDFVACGGELAVIRAQRMNLGSECLHSFLMYRASQPNPTDLLGAMWIIEGLGQKMANEWAERIEAQTATAAATRFLRYHGKNDDRHLDKLYGLLDRICTSAAVADEVMRTSRIVGRLYALQLEEIDHE
jgi:3-oxoacyl-[acyl-carrier-protein] synthase-3